MSQLCDSKLCERQRENLLQFRNLGRGCGDTIHMKSPGASSYLTAPVHLASTIPLSAQTQASDAKLSKPQLAGSTPRLLVSWQATGIITVNCKAQVIVRRLDRRAEAV